MNHASPNESAIDGLSYRSEHVLDEYQHHLAQHGYQQSTQIAYCTVMSHWLAWRGSAGRGSALDRYGVARFITHHLPVCRCRDSGDKGHKMVRAALNQALIMQGHRRIRAEHTESTSTAIEEQIAAFDDYLDTMRGLAGATRHQYRRDVRQFLWWQYSDGPIDIEAINAGHIIAFIRAQSHRLRPVSVASAVGSLRAFFGFQQLAGHSTPVIDRRLLTPPQYRLSSLPSILDAAALERFWASFDATTPIGQRDYAMARCLTDLGLRCAEVANLQLETFEWRNRCVWLTATKMRREALLPLPQATAHAVTTYLRQGRPQTTGRSLFVYHRAPFGTGVQGTTVRGAIRRAFQRAGLPFTGTHVLRRTLATQLLNHGAPLTEIAEVLRHRSIDTTQIYTKVDQSNLCQVVLPWPGGDHE